MTAEEAHLMLQASSQDGTTRNGGRPVLSAEAEEEAAADMVSVTLSAEDVSAFLLTDEEKSIRCTELSVCSHIPS